jgi:hypothetical protein
MTSPHWSIKIQHNRNEFYSVTDSNLVNSPLQNFRDEAFIKISIWRSNVVRSQCYVMRRIVALRNLWRNIEYGQQGQVRWVF